MSDFDPKKEEFKEAFKEGLKEWMDEKYATFGKWALHGILVMAFAGAMWLAFQWLTHKV